MTSVSPRKTYFKGFNTLRFYAALSVVVQHISYSPHDWFGVPLLPVTLERFFLTGVDAVNLFFILSGFLITYLLLAEHNRNGHVNIRNFYIRRAFRIYPVYFTFLGIVLLLLRPAYSIDLLLLLSFFMGNVAYVRFFPFPPLEHLWSIGVEEQYYLLAPMLARLKKHILKILLLIIGLWWTVLFATTLLPQSAISAFILMSRYDFIALGALLAYGYYHQWSFLRLLQHRAVRLLVALLILYAIVFVPSTLNFYYTTLVGFAFVILVYNIAASPRLPTLLENKRLEYMGNLSYSMYVYHPLFVLLFHKLAYEQMPLDQYQLAGYPLIIGLTLGASWVSYRLLESPFLRIKDRFKSSQRVPAVSASHLSDPSVRV